MATVGDETVRQARGPGGGSPRESRAGARARALAAGFLGVSLIVAGCGAAGLRTARGNVGGPDAQPASAPASEGEFTLLDGRNATLATFRGQQAALVWFVADGCASCYASIPAVARHFETFTKAGTRILVLGLPEVFGQSKAGLRDLARFGRGAAGSAFDSSAWTWGVASYPLTVALDPDGVPDAYVLLDRAGRAAYRDVTPVSTMGSLLAHLGRSGATAPAGGGPTGPSAGGRAVLP